MKILLAENSADTLTAVEKFLDSHCYDVEFVTDGKAALPLAMNEGYDMVIVEKDLPGISGCEICARLMDSRCETPVIMISSSKSTSTRIEALDCGADYYVSIPYDEGEFAAIIRSLLRRSKGLSDTLRYDDLVFERSSSILYCGDRSVRLSSRERDVMTLLMKAGLSNVSKEVFLQRVWGCSSDAVDNNVEVYIGFIRKKLRSIGSNVTVAAQRKLGYHLE